MSRPPIDTAQVHRLIAAQFPQWKDLPIRPVDHGGWDNRTFHLGSAMAVRLPSAEGYAAQVAKEHRWLPVLAPQVPLPIPAPLAMGNSWRGGSLSVYDAETRSAIAALGDRIPGGLATEIWDEALSSQWNRPPVWFHGDVAYGNLLMRDGCLAAVIDFGTSGVGDPSCGLAIAWTLLDAESRAAFRAALDLDAQTWARGRGWTLWKALITYDQPAVSGRTSREVADEIFAEFS